MKKGSALLIVLGMLSFMVMSAVAFAMFMRQNRLPSSFLRQKVAASQLVKAGLARALSEIDTGIRNDVYPGIYNSANDYWHHRLFSPAITRVNRKGKSEVARMLSPSDTVSPLNLEALAYLPAPLVNSTRYWSRRVTTAEWKSLGYDAGRYAYVAVNVSDYLDINRIRAGVMRDSTPSNRVSMAYLFEQVFTGDGTQRATKFDSFLEKAADEGGFRTRFVSLADYALALGAKGVGSTGLVSPFYEFIESSAKDGSFYGPNESSARVQKFVTDTWYPPAFNEEVKGSLDGTHEVVADDIGEGLDPLMKKVPEGFEVIRNHLNLAECAALIDYLDEDNIPTSLAMPTLERTPMLTGLQLVPFNFKPLLKVEEHEEEIPSKDGKTKEKITYRAWRLVNLGDDPSLLIGGSAVFPFKRTSGLSERSSYDVEVLAKAFLTSTGDDGVFARTRAPENVKYRPENASDWKDRQNIPEGWWTAKGTGKVTVKHGVKTEDALLDVLPNQAVKFSNISLPDKQGYVYGYKFRSSEPETREMLSDDEWKKYFGKILQYRASDGELKNVNTLIGAAGGASALRLTMMVWVRLLDGNHTVDMVPATIADDTIYNGIGESKYLSNLAGEYTDREGVLPILGPEIVKLDKSVYESAAADINDKPAEVAGLRIYCNDPRYNWAPEDWFVADEGASISGTGWYNTIKNQLDGSGYRPHDFFQFVSNEGYLQSMGELDMLPLVRTSYEDFNEGNPTKCSFHNNANRYQAKGEKTLSREAGNARTIGETANNEYMWNQRWSFGSRGYQHILKREDPYTWGIIDSYGGAAVNPFGEKDIVKCALAYTPYDWIVSGEKFHEANRQLTSSTKAYCFCKESNEAKLDDDELDEIATAFRNKVIDCANAGDWEKIWSDENIWRPTNFFGIDMGEEFHDVDSKFLCAYWRNCFKNQQLFLVFVRAEPTIMGGASAKHTPSQLGGRAVALVWRDPKVVPSTSDIHRMRILFYHQFD